MEGQPTVVLRIGDSALAFTEDGEIVETVEFAIDGVPNWENAGYCDGRGVGGAAGYKRLKLALENAEANAKLCGYKLKRLPA